MSRRNYSLAIAFLVVFACGQRGRADLVVGYDAVDVFPNVIKTLAPTNGVGVTGSDLSTTGLVNRDGLGSDYTWSGFPTGGADAAQSYNFSITSTQAYDLTSLDVRTSRTAAGPMDLTLAIDVGGGYTTVGSLSVPEAATTLSFDLSAYANVTSAAFRLMGFAADNSGANARMSFVDAGNLDGTADLVVTGALAVAVPEASSLLFGGLACCTLGAAVAGRKLVRRRGQ